jgi:hypothetical protein
LRCNCILRASTERDLDTVFVTVAQLRAGALLIGGDAFFASRSGQVAALAARHAIPTISFMRSFAAAGGLMSYGLFRIESERLKLPAPFSRRIAEPLDADATGQAAFNRGFDQIGREDGERDRHVDLSNAALFADANLSDCGYSTGDHISEPPAAVGNGADQASAPLELLRPGVASRCVMREQDPSGFFWTGAAAIPD